MKRNTPLTTEEFITASNIVHKYYYNYTNTVYTNCYTKVTITCPIHGDFEQIPSDHKTGSGCPKCKSDKQTKRQLITTDIFIEKAKTVHGDKYDYSKVDYVHNKSKVTITCPIHGDFVQTPNSHLQKRGCQACTKAKNKDNIWHYTGWKEAGTKSKQFDGYSVYIIECWDDTERFIKIGKTYINIKKRFSSGHLPYEYKVLSQVYGSADFISDLEHQLQKQCKEYTYVPLKLFGGRYECFTANSLLTISIKLKDIYGTFYTS